MAVLRDAEQTELKGDRLEPRRDSTVHEVPSRPSSKETDRIGAEVDRDRDRSRELR